LLYVIDESERHGVVFIDESKWRFFEVFLGEIEEIANAFIDLSDEKPPELPHPAQHVVQGVILRGGATADRFARHIEERVKRFYKRGANVLDKLMDTRRIDRLILLGPHKDTHFFAQYLPRRLRNLLDGHVSSLPKPGASAGEVLNRVAPAIESSRQAQELALLQEVRDSGRWTIPTVLEALQMGKLYLLIAPWRLDVAVWRCASGLVVLDQQAIAAFCPGQEVKKVELRDVLPDLAAAHGARLQFVEREAEGRLLREFGCLAGLSRW
jgi:peptide subunit release factor 1 (eRF1)